jgi:CRISPR/Cas system CSM-associated protein Csm4 (group 5 of RAMP superfamily)
MEVLKTQLENISDDLKELKSDVKDTKDRVVEIEKKQIEDHKDHEILAEKLKHQDKSLSKIENWGVWTLRAIVGLVITSMFAALVIGG